MKLSDVNYFNLYSVPVDQAFEWVKVGLWNKTQFSRYMISIKEHHYDKGYRDGLFGEN